MNSLRSLKSNNSDNRNRGEDQLAAAARRVLDGEPEAFEEIVTALEKKVLATCYGFVGNRDEARELAQDVFLKIYRNLEKFQFNSALSTWVFRICVNRCIDYVNKRKKKNSQNFLEAEYSRIREDARNHDSIDGKLIRKETRKLVRQEIMNLSAKHRDAIILHDFNHMSCKEIAQATNCSEGTVMSRLFHARKKLYGKLREYMEE